MSLNIALYFSLRCWSKGFSKNVFEKRENDLEFCNRRTKKEVFMKKQVVQEVDGGV